MTRNPSASESAGSSGADDSARAGGAMPARSGDLDAPVDVGKAVSEMKRLLEQIESAEQNAGSGSLQAMGRILQYVHDSHARIVKTLENQDRSELFLQSTSALNQTFRKLNQSQDALVEKLLAERRRNPWWIALGAALTGVLVIVAVFLLIDYRNDGLKQEVERMAQARDGLTGAFAESQKAFHEMGTQLGSTVDKVLAANRVLDNESKVKNAEIARLKEELGATATRADGTASESKERERKLAEAEAERKRMAEELDRIRSKLIDREQQVDKLTRLLDEVPALPKVEGNLEAARVETGPKPPERDSPTSPVAERSASEPNPTEGDRTVGGNETSNAATPTQPANQPATEPDPAASVIVPSVDPILADFNEMLASAGVLDHRLLRHGGIVEGRLQDVVLELRSLEGLPIGFRSARTLKWVVDPVALSAKLHLEDGESVDRGERTPFPEGGFDVEIAAITRESLSLAALNPILELSAAPAADPGQSPGKKAPPFDSRVPLAQLNQALARSGRGHLQFTALTGIDGDRLLGVELQHYSGAGTLLKTVIARSCAIEVDDAARRVSLIFRDGRHVTSGREVPFFKGRGELESAATWRLDLDDVEPERWIALKEQLTSIRSENGDPAAADSSP